MNDRRNIGNNIADVNNSVEFPGAAAASVDLPPIDMAKMSQLYQQVSRGDEVSSQDLMTSAFGMMMHMAANMDKVNVMRGEVQNLDAASRGTYSNQENLIHQQLQSTASQ